MIAEIIDQVGLIWILVFQLFIPATILISGGAVLYYCSSQKYREDGNEKLRRLRQRMGYMVIGGIVITMGLGILCYASRFLGIL